MARQVLCYIMRFLSLIVLFSLAQAGYAQFVEKLSRYIAPNKTLQSESALQRFELERPVSSVSVGINPGYSFAGSFIIAGRDTFLLDHDEHGPDMENEFSQLVIFPDPVSLFYFFPAGIKDSLGIFLINDKWGMEPSPEGETKSFSAVPGGFDMPGMIDQKVWREGLKEPDFERIVHEVHNVIIHHSASSNLVTDYTAAIRNIYLYHTEVRGWSDIGYNYVIVANGNIYKGRDPGIYQQDLVMGAHFCSSNRGTMGVCMLGSFTDVIPTDTALISLEKLLVWKLGKDGMDPHGYFPHLINPTLAVIAGHRDGCVTECPGDVLYSSLELMRDRVKNKIMISGIDAVTDYGDNGNDIRIFPNPLDRRIAITSSKKIESISILTTEGKPVQQISCPAQTIDLSNLSMGIYILAINSDGKIVYRTIIKGSPGH